MTRTQELKEGFANIDFNSKQGRRKYRQIRSVARTLVSDILGTNLKCFKKYSLASQGAAIARIAKEIPELSPFSHPLTVSLNNDNVLAMDLLVILCQDYVRNKKRDQNKAIKEAGGKVTRGRPISVCATRRSCY